LGRRLYFPDIFDLIFDRSFSLLPLFILFSSKTMITNIL
jgi:hypothetical protein